MKITPTQKFPRLQYIFSIEKYEHDDINHDDQTQHLFMINHNITYDQKVN